MLLYTSGLYHRRYHTRDPVGARPSIQFASAKGLFFLVRLGRYTLPESIPGYFLLFSYLFFQDRIALLLVLTTESIHLLDLNESHQHFETSGRNP